MMDSNEGVVSPQHEYIWTPAVGEMLVVKIEPTNRHETHAVAIYRDTELVDYHHVPYKRFVLSL